MIGEKIYIKLISTRRGLAGLLGLGCLLISFCLQAQEYSYAHYDVQHGLAGSVVYCGVEDKDGFLWFGTETGLSRFDGTHFTNFTTEDGLPDNEILGLLVDSRNRIWIQPFRGSISYYWKGKIYSAQNDSLLAKIPLSNNLLNISEDKAGNILMASNFNAYIITNQQQVVKVGNMHIGRGAMVSTGLRHNGQLAVVVNVSSLVCDLYEIEAATGNATRVLN